jgi:Na+-translocating ferredoxin:NAD+ oxidoreductase RnfC subunit
MNNTLVINRPENIYVPIIDEDATLIAKVGDYVYKEGILGHTKGDNKEYIFSPVSGRVKDIISSKIYDGEIKQVKSIVIENDYKEMLDKLTGVNKVIDNISKEDFIKSITNYHLFDKNNIYLYVDYLNPINTLIVNISDIDYLSDFYFRNYVNEILEVLDALVEINKIKKCYLFVNKSYKTIIKLIEQHIGTYLNIELVKVRKSLSNIDIINKYEVDNDYYFEDTKTLYNIYNVLKNNAPISDTYIYINRSNNVQYYNVKIGTKIDDLFKILNINDDNYYINDTFATNDREIIIDHFINGIKIDN